jgi:N6-adenosine-specific RNA methylase IME4
MWATAPKLIEALEVMKSWGFQYKTHAVWDKENWGSGYWFRGQHELLLVGVKGQHKPPAQSQRVSSIIRITRGDHSSKPDQVRDMIRDWFPTAKRLELFARKWTSFWPIPEGWDVWGNEAGDAP